MKQSLFSIFLTPLVLKNIIDDGNLDVSYLDSCISSYLHKFVNIRCERKFHFFLEHRIRAEYLNINFEDVEAGLTYYIRRRK